MYEELVAKLRAGEKVFPGWELTGYFTEPFRLTRDDLKEAADAIEELSNYAELYKDLTVKMMTTILNIEKNAESRMEDARNAGKEIFDGENGLL